ncbi:DUF1992 domain-containing protein [Frondihabitans sp. 4ASC-45]|uniref:DnaJ family domain-containing protein n=1 Tax=Frondihabitans sp. 4ASC-45 TaxID=3111636 RepID=UPI003C141FD4
MAEQHEPQDPRPPAAGPTAPRASGRSPAAAPSSQVERVRDTARRDPSLAAVRYRLERAESDARAAEAGAAGADLSAAGATAALRSDPKRAPTAAELRAIAKTALDRAIDAGEFDNSPLAGKPLPGLTGGHDPDWWIKAKIEREGLSGVAPPALSLRTENAQLDDLLDSMATEASVRATLADFNSRIVEARRQLAGGPPVVTPLRDADAEVGRWQARREERRAAEAESAALAQAEEAAQQTTWRARRRAARARRAQERGLGGGVAGS